MTSPCRPAARQDWTLNSLTFEASGTGDHQNAWAELALYEDGGNGQWDGTPSNSLASTQRPAGFDGSNQVTFDLSTPTSAGLTPPLLSGRRVQRRSHRRRHLQRAAHRRRLRPAPGRRGHGPSGCNLLGAGDSDAVLTIRNSSTQPRAVTPHHRHGGDVHARPVHLRP
jgi:hypothetical protein